MLQATPFDLCLFTGAGILPLGNQDLQHSHLRDLFIWFSRQMNNTNQRLQKNPTLQHCRLVLPMTEDLFEALQNTPSWQEARGHGALYQHKALVLSFLKSSYQQGGSPILHLAQDNTHLYTVIDPADYFVQGVSETLQNAWKETSGTCVFGNAKILEPGESASISACWVISAGRGQRPDHIEIQAQPIESGIESENRTVTMLSWPFTCPDEIEQIDFWPWEKCIRQALWQDERLPFNGPDGFGFRPDGNSNWQPGRRPFMAPGQVHGYLDDFGGIWQWEGGRAALHTPFEGHWNVQLISGSAVSAWQSHLSDHYNQHIRLLSNHLNIEADGSIVDYTFEML